MVVIKKKEKQALIFSLGIVVSVVIAIVGLVAWIVDNE